MFVGSEQKYAIALSDWFIDKLWYVFGFHNPHSINTISC